MPVSSANEVRALRSLERASKALVVAGSAIAVVDAVQKGVDVASTQGVKAGIRAGLEKAGKDALSLTVGVAVTVLFAETGPLAPLLGAAAAWGTDRLPHNN